MTEVHPPSASRARSTCPRRRGRRTCSEEEIVAELSASDAGRAWLEDLESRKHPWFYMSTGDGLLDP